MRLDTRSKCRRNVWETPGRKLFQTVGKFLKKKLEKCMVECFLMDLQDEFMKGTQKKSWSMGEITEQLIKVRGKTSGRIQWILMNFIRNHWNCFERNPSETPEKIPAGISKIAFGWIPGLEELSGKFLEQF